MRPALHRAALRRLLLRVAVLMAWIVAAIAALLPAEGLSEGTGYPAFAAFLVATGIAVGLSIVAALRRPRPRATAPRALVSRA